MTVPEAVDLAKKRLSEVMPDLKEGVLHLEELEVPPGGSKWKFTFTSTKPLRAAASLDEIYNQRRVAKTVEIDSTTGALIAVRNSAA